MQIFLILVLAFILRVIALGQSFWLDETIGVLAAKNQGWIALLTQWPKGDNHPPLYYLMLKGWGDTFGYSEVAIRLLSVGFGVLTVFLVYKIAKEFIKNKEHGNLFPVFSALLVATSPLHIYFSQEARMYVVAGTLVAGAVYFFIRTLKSNRFWNFFGFSIFLTLLVFSDYLPGTTLLVFWLYGIGFVRNKTWWLLFVVSHLPLAILGYFWLPIYKIQSQAGAIFLATLPSWKSLAGGANVKQLILVWTKFTLGRISFFNKTFYYSLLGIVSVPFLVALFFSIKKFKKVILFWLWLITPLILGFLISFFVPAFNYFRFIFILPAFYLLLAWGVWRAKPRLGNVLAIFLIVFNLLGWGLYAFNPVQQREDWRGAVSFVENTAPESSLVVFANPEPFAPYQWYSKNKIPTKGLLGSVKINETETKDLISESTQGMKNIYFFTYLFDLMDPGGFIPQTLIELGYHVEKEHSTFRGVGKIMHFAR